MAPRVKNPARVLAGQKSAVTRSARARGVDPARAWAAVQGWATRRRAVEWQQREHGRKAREATERRLTPAGRAKRTRDAQRIKTAASEAREARERPVTRGRQLIHSIDDFEDYPDFDDGEHYDAEGHQETTGKKGGK